LSLKLLLRDCTALLALANHLAVLEIGLHVRISTARAHKRYSEERTRLRTDVAAVILELGLITKNGVNVD
jgi:hypothetical protein